MSECCVVKLGPDAALQLYVVMLCSDGLMEYCGAMLHRNAALRCFAASECRCYHLSSH